ncbi:MAG: GSCFA domain-containing protein [Janthinobacterium lividum]
MFRTELTIAPQERLLPRTARVLTVGSCFADSIGERLRLNKVNALVNPFGTVFQPLALAQLLRAAAGEEQDWQQHVVEARGRWQSYDFHSTIGAESPVELLQAIQDKVRQVGEFIRTADTVVLTLGTAWAYRLRETGELVSNLHKLPAGLFEKELLTADEIVNGLAEVHALLRRVNPEIRIVLTVSPVRHIKDTLPLNAVSKSVLRVACHYLSELLPNVSYFPAYELLTDDLRDYRFYAADMLHPSDVAEDYIWERFARAYFDADFGRFRKEWAAVRQSLGHRPLHIGAPEHRTFLDQTRERLERMTSQGVDVRQELRDVQRQLAALPPPRPVRVPEVEPDDDEERIDIGDGIAVETTATTQPAENNASQNRRNDNRRDGRRNDRSGRDRRDNRPTPVPQPIAEEPVLEVIATEVEPAESVAASVEALLVHPEAELLVPTPEEAGYPAKKKKRRSRGGAKRTARKNAARQAAEQEDDQVTSDDEASLIEEESFADNGSEVGEFATETSVEELVVPVYASESEPTDTSTDDVLPAAQPTRKRGTGPTPKKSKVITKSGLVKRGQRGSLYRAATEATEAPTPAPSSAPIISPPIIPEIFMERPASDYAVLAPPPAELDLAATVLGLFSSKPRAPIATPPKRGRPKAAATAAEATTPTDIEPTPIKAPEPISPVIAEPAAAATKPAKAPAKKAAPRSAKTAKPAAKKPTAAAAKPAATKKATAKPAAKPATQRRGRPPGTKTPPATEAPDA